ncbi:MAG: Arc family DNA-binding protein [Sphingomicrobium sp.]
MATQDHFVKTALRLPRGLHAEIQAAANAAGRSMNAEIIDRLQSGSAEATAALLKRLEGSERALMESQRKQIDVLWNVIDRAEGAIDRAERMVDGANDAETSGYRTELQFLRELIETIRAHR